MIRDLHTLDDDALYERIQERQAELAALKSAQRERNNYTETQKLATEMHRVLCRNTHNNPGYDCDWPHEDNWTRFTHKRYHDAASTVLRATGGYDKALEVITVIWQL